MIKTAMPKIPSSLLKSNNLDVTVGYWTSRCKTSYKKLNHKLKDNFEILLNKLLNLEDVAVYGPHTVKLKGGLIATDIHLEPNISASSDTSNVSKPIKHKGDYLMLYITTQIKDYIVILILDVGDHSILKNDYSDFK